MEIQNNQKVVNMMVSLSPYIPIITPSVNGFNSPIKMQRAVG